MFGLRFGMHYFVSFLVLQSSSQGEGSWLLCFFVFLLSFDCQYSVALYFLIIHVLTHGLLFIVFWR